MSRRITKYSNIFDIDWKGVTVKNNSNKFWELFQQILTINPGLSDHYMIEIDPSFHFKPKKRNIISSTIRLYDKAATENNALMLEFTQ